MTFKYLISRSKHPHSSQVTDDGHTDREQMWISRTGSSLPAPKHNCFTGVCSSQAVNYGAVFGSSNA
jgi:hypothetical protein